ncbi:hypothetical protein [Pseudoalteromonas sp. B160]|uniref:hypothetical protein n=1 Tax=Pseudoalteromonas sp. B160 TaxID=630414 RepID=UPI00301CDC4A
MKKIYLVLFGAAMFSSATMANTVSCYVDTDAYDNYTENYCYGSGQLSNHRQGAVVFKVDVSKPVQNIIWTVDGFLAKPRSNSCTGEICIVDVRHGESEVSACVDKIYYQDYTWADVNWCANASTNFWGEGKVPQ